MSVLITWSCLWTTTTWSWFHQHFTQALLLFFVWKCFAQLSLDTFQHCNFCRQKIGAKCPSKMLMKLTPANNQAIAQSDILDYQSNTNPSQICDWQSKYNFQNGLKIQSKSNHNPTISAKRYRTANIKWPSFMMKPWNLLSTYTLLIN